MRFFLDTNIWSYIANEDAGSELAMRARAAGVEIVVSSAVVDEVQQLPVPDARRKVIRLLTENDWKRLMPEVFSECAEVKAEIIRLRPEWVIAKPNMREFNRVRYDWVRRTGGFWDRARREIDSPPTNESVRREQEENLAVEQSFAIRERLKKIRPGVRHIYSMSDTSQKPARQAGRESLCTTGACPACICSSPNCRFTRVRSESGSTARLTCPPCFHQPSR